jgi:rhodanese-related sulfurtransferase
MGSSRKEADMPQAITTGYKALLEAAEREIETLSVEDAARLHGRDDVVFVDIRDPREQTREGKMPGAFSCTRGMLEFWIDPESPYHKPVFAQDKRFCSSAPAAGAPPWRRRPRIAWALSRSRTSAAGSANGRRRASRWKWWSRSRDLFARLIPSITTFRLIEGVRSRSVVSP